MTSPDVIVIGGGVIGAASAFFASRAGLTPLIIEKRGALGTLTTSASLAAFRAQFADSENIGMMKESISFFEEVARDTDIGLVQHGYLFASTTEEGYDQAKERVELQRSLGLDDVELWDGAEARRHWPFLSDEVVAATFRSRDGWLSAHELTYFYARASCAQVKLDTKVEGILVKAGRVEGVKTQRGEIYSKCVILAAGPFAKQLVQPVGVELPIQLVRHQRVAIKQHPLIPADAPMTIDADTGAHWRPDGHGAVLAWGLPEEPEEPKEEVLADWEFPAKAIEGTARISPFWYEVADNLRRSDLDVRAGQYDMTPDARPIIGEHPAIAGLYLNCGYSGHGVMGSAAGSRLLADLVTEKVTSVGNPFRPDRFSEPGAQIRKLVL